MSEQSNGNNNSQFGKAVGVAEATKTAVNQSGASEPDLMNMTGEEAKAYVAAQKAAKESGKAPVAGKPVPKEGKVETLSDIAKEAAKKYKVKVDGQELEVDEQELLRGYTHQKAANKKLQEGLAARKQAEQFVAMMKDPEKFYETAKKLGHDPRLLAEKYLAAQLEDELLDPRDKELKEAKRKLKHIEDMERQQKEAVEKQRNEALKAKYAKDYSDQFVSALEETGLPPTKPMVAEMAKYISRSAQLGFKMTAAEAAQLVKEDIQIAHQRLIGDADGETLIRLLGDQVANKVRKFDVAKLKSPESQLKTPQEQSERTERPKNSGKRMSAKEWREFNRTKK
jgi:hypothetical protein